MALPDRQHRELAARVPLAPDAVVLDIGCGPGQLLAALKRREPSIACCGVDPSALMVSAARRRNPAADVRAGAAEELPFGKASVDVVVSINSIRLWPDIDAALAEIDRVLAPDGRALVAWHGGHNPVGHQRKLVYPATELESLDAAFRERFATSTRERLQHSELWTI